MTTFKQQLELDLVAVFFKKDVSDNPLEFNETVIYQGQTISAIITRQNNHEKIRNDVAEFALIYLIKSEIPTDESADRVETVDFDGATWLIDHREMHDDFVEKVIVRKGEGYAFDM